jgi:hypothetical protein
MTINRPIRTLRDLRANSEFLDQHDTALTLPPKPEYRHGGEANRPAIGAVNDPGALTAWCIAEGMNPAPVVGLAMWHAVRMWYRGTGERAATTPLTSVVMKCYARLKGKPTSPFPVAAFQAANRANALWHAAGRPLFDIACGDTQRTVIGLRKVAARGAR